MPTRLAAVLAAVALALTALAIARARRPRSGTTPGRAPAARHAHPRTVVIGDVAYTPARYQSMDNPYRHPGGTVNGTYVPAGYYPTRFWDPASVADDRCAESQVVRTVTHVPGPATSPSDNGTETAR